MTQENDVIAIIVIVLFFILALIAFGIYHLVSLARGGESSSGTESESGSRSLVDD
jgi:flagellar biogenesis protein FliO